MAVASLVLGIVGFFISFLPLVNLFAMFLAVIGLILGIVGLVQAKKGDGKRGMAIAGIVLCVLAFAITIVVTIGVIAFAEFYGPNISDWSSFDFPSYH